MIILKMCKENQGEKKIRSLRLLTEELEAKEPQQPPNLRSIDRRKVKESSAIR